jgi:hypothetical protein
MTTVVDGIATTAATGTGIVIATITAITTAPHFNS